MATAIPDRTAGVPIRPAPRGLRARSWIVPVVGLILLAAAALSVDLRLSQACQRGVLPGDIERLIHLSEVFGHGAGVALILITAWVLDPTNRRQLPRVAASAYGAGLLANAVKLLISRSRPNSFQGQTVLDTFQAWLPFVPGRTPGEWGHGLQGFPSAHAATAMGLALGLAVAYPRGRWLFIVFAALASFQRVAAGAHYLSDVLFGAALGCFVAVLLRRSWLARRFDRWEQKSPETEIPRVWWAALAFFRSQEKVNS